VTHALRRHGPIEVPGTWPIDQVAVPAGMDDLGLELRCERVSPGLLAHGLNDGVSMMVILTGAPRLVVDARQAGSSYGLLRHHKNGVIALNRAPR